MPVIARYLALYPEVEIEFTLVSWNVAMRQLQERAVDVAIIVEPDEGDGLFTREIGRTRYMAFAHRDHPLANLDAVTIAELAQHILIVPEDGSLTQRVVREKAAKLGVTLPRIVKTHTFPMVKEAILHGVGVGLMLEGGQYPSANLVAIEVTDMPEIYPVCLSAPADKRDLRLVKSFCDVALGAPFGADLR